MTGRDNTAAWQWMQVYAQDANRGTVFETGKDSGNRITINKNNSAVNTDVHWDKDYKTNVGIDAQFLNNRLAVTFDYYYGVKEPRRSLNEYQADCSFYRKVHRVLHPTSVRWIHGVVSSLSHGRIKSVRNFKYRIGINTGLVVITRC